MGKMMMVNSAVDCLSVDYVDAVGEDVLHQSAVHDYLGIEFLVEDGYLMAHLF